MAGPSQDGGTGGADATAHGAPERGGTGDGAGDGAAAGSLGRRFAPDDACCELCGEPQLDRHCKVVCPRCGFIRDCSDP
ncbi:MAG: hypothetical protein JNL90_02470 [Planctomycetes bacterium]|nr:hypothetical protein [Planctomycetota bacterium]